MRHATSAVISSVLLVAAVSGCRSGSDASAQRSAVPFVAVDPASTSPTDQAIATAQARLRLNPADDGARLDLARAFLQKVRETADPTLYRRADGLLSGLGRDHPDNPDILVTRGTLALAQHRFTDALTYGRQALAAAPGNETAYGVLVDADNELGRYTDALAATQAMVNTKPTLASLSRVSYARELRGDLPGAIDAMTQAITAAGTDTGENVAYVQVLLGNLLLNSGDVPGADTAYTAAETAFPGFAAARAGHAQVLVARGHPDQAATLLTDVVRVQPLAQYAIAEGDAFTATGETAQARRAYDLVDIIARLFAANNVNIDLELALFDADHHPGHDALARARNALHARPSGLGHDVLAWNLYQTGDLHAAARESHAALALGSHDPQEQFHAAMIADTLGDTAAATQHLQIVLDTNPRFSAFLEPQVLALAHKLRLPVPDTR